MSMTRRALVPAALAAMMAWPLAAGACHTIFVGKDASADGCVLMAHTYEMGGGIWMQNFRKVPRIQHGPGETVTLDGGAKIPQVAMTYAYLWSEGTGSSISDAFLNEWGVAISSDRAYLSPSAHFVPSQIVEGGIGYMLRRIVAERARTAREGVEIAGALVSKYGYTSNQALLLADSKEGWIMGLARGNRWVARRVPDDAVVVLESAGYQTGPEDMTDKRNFMGSSDLVEYAVKQGWYDPKGGEPFRYIKVYGGNTDPKVDGRQYAMSLVARKRVLPNPDGWFPFAVYPPTKLGVADLMAIVRSHKFYICNEIRLDASVYQLRDNLPGGINAVWWRAAGEPCTAVFVPWYAGITDVPAEFAQQGELAELLSLKHHHAAQREEPPPAWKTAWTLQEMVNADRKGQLKAVRAAWDPMERKMLEAQKDVDARARELHTEQGPEAAMKYLTDYCRRVSLQTLAVAEKMTEGRAYERSGPTPNDGHRSAGDPYPVIPETPGYAEAP